MQLAEKHVLEFQRLYSRKYKIKLSYDEAYSQCMDMMILGGIVYSPLTKQNVRTLEKIEKRGTI
jgi:hypothetical protein